MGRIRCSSGYDHAARTVATAYSPTAPPEWHAVDRLKYPTSVLHKIAASWLSELERFLSGVWQAGRAREPEPTTSATSPT